MELKSPALSSMAVKGERGLTAEAYLARGDSFILSPLLVALAGVALQAGQETAVAVDVPGLPPNANLTKITATLTVAADSPGSITQNMTVTQDSDPAHAISAKVDNAPGIRNVQVRLNQGTVFWTHSGAAAPGDYPIPDFSSQVNAYLDKYQSKDGKVTLQFMIKSDVAGHVSLTLDPGFEFSLLQTQSWKNDLDSTFRVDRTLALTFNQTQQLSIDSVTAPAGRHVTLSQIRLDAGGKFGPERLLGSVETHDGHQFATVSTDFAIAQQVTLVKSLVKTAVQSTGATLYLEADAAAEIYIEIQSDQNGSPADAAPLAKANVQFQPVSAGAPQPWTFAKFEKPAQLQPDSPYWMVAKGVRGAVRLGLMPSVTGDSRPAERGALLLNRSGQIWKPFAAAAIEGLLSLVYLPQSDNQTAAIEITVAGTGQRIDPQTAPKTFSFPGSSAGSPVLLIDSRALGSLTVANVIQEYTLV